MSTLPTDRRSPWASRSDVAEYVEQLVANTAPAPRTGHLIFALDATASREPSWDRACAIQGEMFEATTGLGGLDVKLVYYRGFDECGASRWVGTAADLHRLMKLVSCQGGYTQIEKVLALAVAENQKHRIGALVFVGDAMEEEKQFDSLCHYAGELGRLGTPIFLFHEGNDPKAASAFKQMATLSKGAYLPFDLSSSARLKELFGGIAVYATGGHQALENYSAKKGGEILRLTAQLRRSGG